MVFLSFTISLEIHYTTDRLIDAHRLINYSSNLRWLGFGEKDGSSRSLYSYNNQQGIVVILRLTMSSILPLLNNYTHSSKGLRYLDLRQDFERKRDWLGHTVFSTQDFST